MSLTLTGAALPRWAVVLTLLALTPLPMAVPSGIALAAIGLMGSAFLFRHSRQHAPALLLARPCASRVN
jgi:hypothetical protein